MPLEKSSSKEAVGNNIRTLRKENYPLNQAVAIALSEQRRAKGQKGKYKPGK